MKVNLIDIKKYLKGSVFEHCCDEVQYNLYWIKWLLTCYNSYSSDRELNPILIVFYLYKQQTLKFLLEDNVSKDDKIQAFEINDKLPSIMDAINNWSNKNISTYNNHLREIGPNTISFLQKPKEENIFLKIFESSKKINNMQKSITSKAPIKSK
jgi:hypothetical protein